MNRLLSNPLRLAIGSIFVALAVLALKYAAWALTNSVGLYSDALETIVNLSAAIAVLIAVRMGEIPPDHNHQYGHHKAEYLSAVLEGFLVLVAAIAIFWEAIETFHNPRTLDVPFSGLFLNACAGVLNGIWALVLVRRGRILRSPALVADGKHLFTDVFSSLGILVGIAVALWSGLHWLDPLLAILVGINILYTGWGLLKTSLSGLMDEAVDEKEQEHLRALIMANAEGAIEAHDLRTRHAGRVVFVEFHLVVPSAMSVFDAHEICDRIEHGIQAHMPHANITIHIEPEDKAMPPDHSEAMVFSARCV